jgi:hypothetical protein
MAWVSDLWRWVLGAIHHEVDRGGSSSPVGGPRDPLQRLGEPQRLSASRGVGQVAAGPRLDDAEDIGRPVAHGASRLSKGGVRPFALVISLAADA